jgi:predicted ATP-grasp superfamily ATP-dependent carboligase
MEIFTLDNFIFEKILNLTSDDPVIDYKLDPNILLNKTNYFLTLLDDRFDIINNYLKQALEKKYDMEFNPIYVLANKLHDKLTKSNYIIINSQLKSLKDNRDLNKILIPEHEDLNLDVSNSKFIKDLLLLLLKKQNKIFINTFTTSFLNLDVDNVIYIGPDPFISKYFDSKINQKSLLNRLCLPTPKEQIYNDFDEVESLFKEEKFDNFFIYSEYCSGGYEVGAIRNYSDLMKFKNSIRKKNLKNRFIVAEILNKKAAPNSTAIVLDENKVLVLSISDQIEDDTKYLGNIYPSKVNHSTQKKLIEYTRTIGQELSKEGYRGFFGCDFVITHNEDCYIVDINPRKQGGFLCNFLMFKKIMPKVSLNLVELELNAILGERIEYDLSSFENPEINFYWAHSKIQPINKNSIIKSELLENGEEECFEKIGTCFIKSFFPEGYIFINGSLLGHIIKTGINYDNLLSEIFQINNTIGNKLLNQKGQII